MKKLSLLAVILGLFGILFSPLLPTSAASTTAVVGFTDHALNPADPGLPLTDNPRVKLPDTNGDSHATKQVVVNTTPEQTKTTTTNDRKRLADTSASSRTRTKLPQTGSVEMSSITVVTAIAMSLMLGVGVWRKSSVAA